MIVSLCYKNFFLLFYHYNKRERNIDIIFKTIYIESELFDTKIQKIILKLV